MIDLFRGMKKEGHEQLLISSDSETGMKAIISIHSTVLGPALGGCRVWEYKNFNAAVGDALRLSRAMTFKAAIHGLNLGGGKAVLSLPPGGKTPEILRAFGRVVDSLTGLYITAEDVGMSVKDLDIVREVTRYATGISVDAGGGGDPSPLTALGVLTGMRVCLQEVFQTDSFQGRVVAIQGVGKVGGHLAELLAGEGAELILTDLNKDRVRAVAARFKAKVVSPKNILSQKCDILAPAALGGGLNSATIPELRCRIVAGPANNQLGSHADDRRLARRKILYAPDFVINGGGLINIACELEGYDPEKARRNVMKIKETIGRIFDRARLEKITPLVAADLMVEERLAKVKAGPSGP